MRKTKVFNPFDDVQHVMNYHACAQGDCFHDKQTECDAILKKAKDEALEDFKKKCQLITEDLICVDPLVGYTTYFKTYKPRCFYPDSMRFEILDDRGLLQHVRANRFITVHYLEDFLNENYTDLVPLKDLRMLFQCEVEVFVTKGLAKKFKEKL